MSTLREAAQQQNFRVSNRQDFKQHCQKIEQRLANLDTRTSPVRAICELFQNATDLTRHARIRISYDGSEIVFAHNGKPFTPDSLGSLIKQVSAEEKEGKDTVGQYGTGFVQTHCFGRCFYINGSLQYYPEGDPDNYVSLDHFMIDRTFDTIDQFIDKMSDQVRAKDELISNGELTKEVKPMTELHYICDSQYCRNNAQKAIADIVKLMPYILTVNERIEECMIEDRVNGMIRIWTKSQGVDEFNAHVMDIHCTINGTASERKVYYICDSEHQNTIMLPITEGGKVIRLDDIPKLFFQYPLLGSEEFGMNFIFESSRFKPVENRDGLFLPMDNPANKAKYEENVIVLNDMADMLMKWLGNLPEGLTEVWNFFGLGFKCPDNDDEKTRDFFKQFTAKWVDGFSELEVIPTKDDDGSDSTVSLNSDSSLMVLPKSLSAYMAKAEEGVDLAIYTCIAANNGGYHLPVSDAVLQWSAVINSWKVKSHVIDLETIASTVSEDVDLDDLHELLLAFGSLNRKDLLEDYAIVPNRQKEYREASELFTAPMISDDLYALVYPIAPSDCETLVDPKFTDVYDFTEYDLNDLRNAVGDQIDKQRKATIDKGKQLSVDLRNALTDFAASYFSLDETARYRRDLCMAVASMEGRPSVEYCQLSVNNADDARDLFTKAFNIIIENVMLEIEGKDEEWVAQNGQQLYAFIKDAGENSHFRDNLFGKYAIWPNQNGTLCTADDLYACCGIDDELADIYQAVTGNDPKAAWVDADYEIFYDFNKQECKDLADEIEEVLAEDNYLDGIVERIIIGIDKGYWKDCFSYITEHRYELDYKLKDPETKEFLYNLQHGSCKDLMPMLMKLVDRSDASDLVSKIERMLNPDDVNDEDDCTLRQLEIGDEGEAYVYEMLCEKYGALNVEWSNLCDEQHADRSVLSHSGQTYYLCTTSHDYDLKVKTPVGIEFYEVKSTTASGRMRFFFQQSELDAARHDACPKHSYYHVLVCDVEDSPKVAVFKQD